MGNQPTQRPPPRVSLDDAIIEMKIQTKQIQRAAKNSQKESDKYMKKAKQALKKNNQQGAKMYLMSSSAKKRQALNYQRTATKMDIMCQRIKSNANNQKLVCTFGNMAHVVSQQMNQMDPVKMSDSLQLLNNKMDEMMINTKMMEQMMQQNDVVQNNTVDQMMNVLKQQLAMEDTNNLNSIPQQQQMNYNQNNQNALYTGNNPNPKGGMKEGQSHDPFLDQLKGL